MSARAKNWKRNLKARLFLEQSGKCHLCGEPMNQNAHCNDPKSVTLDHLLPKVNGGRKTRENLKLAHRVCNIRRGHTPYELIIQKNSFE